jgi:hypothetical protein
MPFEDQINEQSDFEIGGPGPKRKDLTPLAKAIKYKKDALSRATSVANSVVTAPGYVPNLEPTTALTRDKFNKEVTEADVQLQAAIKETKGTVDDILNNIFGAKGEKASYYIDRDQAGNKQLKKDELENAISLQNKVFNGTAETQSHLRQLVTAAGEAYLREPDVKYEAMKELGQMKKDGTLKMHNEAEVYKGASDIAMKISSQATAAMQIHKDQLNKKLTQVRQNYESQVRILNDNASKTITAKTDSFRDQALKRIESSFTQYNQNIDDRLKIGQITPEIADLERADVKKQLETDLKSVDKEAQEQAAAEFDQQYGEKYKAETQARYQNFLDERKYHIAKTEAVQKRINQEAKQSLKTELDAYSTKIDKENAQDVLKIQDVYKNAWNKVESGRRQKDTDYREAIMGIPMTGKYGLLFGKAFEESWGNMMASTGKYFESLGLGGWFNDFLIGHGSELAKESHIYKPDISWNNFFKPSFLSQSIGSTSATALPTMVIGAVTGSAGAAATIGTMMEAWANGGDTYQQGLDMGYDPAEASQMASSSFWTTVGTFPAQLIESKVFVDALGGRKALRKMLTETALSGVSEAVAEDIQTAGQAAAVDKKTTIGKEMGKSPALKAGAEGGLGGMAMGGAGHIFGGISQVLKDSKAIHGIGEQYMANLIQKDGVSRAKAMVEHAYNSNDISDEQLESETAKIDAIDSKLNDAKQIGLSNEQASAFVGLSSEIEQEQESVNNINSPVLKDAAQKRVDEKKKTLDGIIDGTEKLATIRLSNGTEFTAPSKAVKEILADKHIQAAIQENDIAIRSEDSSINKQVEKLTEVNENGKPDGNVAAGIETGNGKPQENQGVLRELSANEISLLNKLDDNKNKLGGIWKDIVSEHINNPDEMENLVDTVTSQIKDDPETGKKIFGKEIVDTVLKAEENGNTKADTGTSGGSESNQDGDRAGDTSEASAPAKESGTKTELRTDSGADEETNGEVVDEKADERRAFLEKFNEKNPKNDFVVFTRLSNKDAKKAKLNAMSRKLIQAKREKLISDQDFDGIAGRIDANYKQIGEDANVMTQEPNVLLEESVKKEIAAESGDIEIDKPVTNKAKAKKISEKLHKLADMIEGDKSTLKSDITALPRAVLANVVRAGAKIIEAGGSIADAIQAGVQFIKDNTGHSDEKELTDSVRNLYRQIGFVPVKKRNAVDEGYRQGVAEGKLAGEIHGKQKGRQEGKKEGFREGVKAEKNKDSDLNDAKSIRSKLKKAVKAKSKDRAASSIATAKDFLRINPDNVSDIEEYSSIAGKLLGNIKGVSVKTEDGEGVVTNENYHITNDQLERYIEAQEKVAEAAAKSKLASNYQDLVKQGVIDPKNMSLREMTDIIDAVNSEDTDYANQYLKEVALEQGKLGALREVLDYQMMGLKEWNVENNALVGEPPSEAQIAKDVRDGSYATFEYGDKSEIPALIRDKVSSISEINGKTKIRVTVPQSVADYYLSQKESDLSEGEKEVVDGLLKIDTSKLNIKQLARLNDVINNIIVNGDLIGAGNYAILGQYQENAVEMIDKEKKSGVKLSDISNPLVQGIPSTNLLTEFLTKESKLAAEIQRLSGITGIFDGHATAAIIQDKAMKEYTDLKEKAGSEIDSPYNVFKRGAIAYLLQAEGATQIERDFDFNKRKDELVQSMENLDKSDNQEERLKGEEYKRVYFDLVKEAKTLGDLKIDDDAKALIEDWEKRWAEVKEIVKENTELYDNEIFVEVSNHYTSTKMESVKGADKSDETFASKKDRDIFADVWVGTKINNTPAKTKIARKANKRLGETMYIDLDFDHIQAQRFYETMYNVETSKAIAMARVFFDSNESRQILGNSTNKKILKDSVKKSVDIQRGKLPPMDALQSAVTSSLNILQGKGVRVALGSISQFVKQYPSVAFNTVVNLGKDAGLFFKALRSSNDLPIFDHLSIGIRGKTKAGFNKEVDLNVLDKTTIGKTFNESLDAFKKWGHSLGELIMSPLVKSDVAVARTSWKAYYMQDLKKQGLSTNVNWAEEHLRINREAAAYAEQMVARNQNPNDPSALGNIHKDKKGWTAVLINTVMPFSTFGTNMRMRLTNDCQKILFGHKKGEAWRSLGATMTEMIVFNSIKTYFLSELTSGLAHAIAGSVGMWGDKDKEKYAKNHSKEELTKKVLANSISDFFFSGMGTSVQNLSNLGLNALYKAATATEENPNPQLFYSYKPSKRDFSFLGLYGVVPTKIADMAYHAPEVFTGETTKYTKGGVESKAESEKVELTPEERRILIASFIVDAAALVGASDAEVSSANNKLKTIVDQKLKEKYGGETTMTLYKKAKGHSTGGGFPKRARASFRRRLR